MSALPGRGDEDAALMTRVRVGRDRAALGAIAEHYAPRLKAWLMNRGEEAHTAEDIAQDVMIAVWNKAALFDPERGSFSTWVFRMTRNRWIDHKRKHDRVQPTSPGVVAEMADAPVAGAEAAFEQTEAAAAVRHEMAQLSAEQKHVLHLAFFEGLTHSEIAERTGLALGTVKSRIRAPLKKMRARLENFREIAS
ncbi:MAG: sigma-70 family RNA polymerase sigma factor [Pseudomonadota bacterium]